MNEQYDWHKLAAISEEYVEMVREELAARWDSWTLDLAKREMFEAVGGLLARQVTLAVQMARAPSIWNGHIAPILLRTMTDTYISLAWILDDPLERARKFILHGLGQEKLGLEHRKASLVADGYDPEEDPIVNATESWINTQRYTFLTEVNIGSWSGKSTRDMAEEAGCLDFYNCAYTPFSAATHSTWMQVSKYNLATCPNPLHRYHKVPIDPLVDCVEPDYFYTGAKYVDKAFRLFDVKTGVETRVPCALVALAESLRELYDGLDDKESEAAEGD